MLKKIVVLAWVVLFYSLPLPAETLKFGILPVMETLHLQVAVKEGFFKAENLDVKLINFNSAMEMNTAVHTGQIKGYYGDMITSMILIDKGSAIKMLTLSYSSNPDQRMFGIVTSPKRSTPAPGQTLNIAISRASIIEYLLTNFKGLDSVSQYQFKPVEIKQMPIRLQMLLAGEMDSALLPEPLLSLAVSRGGKLLVTDQALTLPLTVLNLATDHSAVAGRFLNAYKKAIAAINKDPEKYRDLMAKTCRIPKPLVKKIHIFHYPVPRVPTEKEIEQVQSWMMEKNLLENKIPYSDVVFQ